MSCTEPNCILWGVSAVGFSIAMVLAALLILAPCFNVGLFALISLLFRWFKRSTWIPVLYKLVGSTLWFIRFGCAFGIYSLLAPTNTNALIVVFYVFAVPFCLSLLYWSFRVLKQIGIIICEEDSARFAEKQAQLAKVSTFSNFDFGANAIARQNSVQQLVNLLRYGLWLLLLWVAFQILGIEVGVLLDETSFFCLVLVLPLAQVIRSFSLGVLWLFIFERDEWGIGFSAGNVVVVDHHPECELKSCGLRIQVSKNSLNGALVYIPHGYFSDRLGASVNGRRKITTPFSFKLGLALDVTTKQIAAVIDRLQLYLSTIHLDLSTNYETGNMLRGGQIAFDCENWALDVHVNEVQSTFESEDKLFGEIVLGMVEAMGSAHLGREIAQCPRSAPKGYVYYMLELPLKYD
ncbi:hypothetical protein BASA81_000498 [Batrachochytrium salamandrivorans]|nr:hypothetical protein BASA81_000498 [Batrachochytrium salamandrivorans]